MSALRGKAEMARCECPLLRLLSGVKQTSPVAARMSACDPKQTLQDSCFNVLVSATIRVGSAHETATISGYPWLGGSVAGRIQGSNDRAHACRRRSSDPWPRRSGVKNA